MNCGEEESHEEINMNNMPPKTTEAILELERDYSFLPSRCPLDCQS